MFPVTAVENKVKCIDQGETRYKLNCFQTHWKDSSPNRYSLRVWTNRKYEAAEAGLTQVYRTVLYVRILKLALELIDWHSYSTDMNRISFLSTAPQDSHILGTKVQWLHNEIKFRCLSANILTVLLCSTTKTVCFKQSVLRKRLWNLGTMVEGPLHSHVLYYSFWMVATVFYVTTSTAVSSFHMWRVCSHGSFVIVRGFIIACGTNYVWSFFWTSMMSYAHCACPHCVY